MKNWFCKVYTLIQERECVAKFYEVIEMNFTNEKPLLVQLFEAIQRGDVDIEIEDVYVVPKNADKNSKKRI